MATLGAIDRFRASVLKDGVARPSKYEVRITPPENIKNVLEGSSLDIVSRNIGMACNSIVMPGRDLTAISVKQGQDLAREHVGAHTYEGTITATFYLDPNLDYKTFFEAWQNLAVNPITNNLNYYDNYIGSMSIHQLGSIPVTETTITLEQDRGDGTRPYTIKLFDFDSNDPLEKNDFLVTNQFKLLGHKDDIFPDVVLFVNGIPLVVIECKSPETSHPISEAINNNLKRYQMRNTGFEQLFYFNQVLVACCGTQAKYAPTFGEAHHYKDWNDPFPLDS